MKITFKGETKRIKIPESYEHLVALTRVAFSSKSGDHSSDELILQCKFFYIDEEDEIISISSEEDFREAIHNEDLSSLKLVIAKDSKIAVRELQSIHEESTKLLRSITQNL